MGSSSIVRAAATATLFVVAAVVPSNLRSQAIVRGVLYDDAKGTPLTGTILLVDPSTDAAVVHIATDSAGQFSLKARNGAYQIAAIRPGYKSVLSAPVRLQDGERLTVRVPIAMDGDPVHQIGVTEHVRPNQDARAQVALPDRMNTFRLRQATGTGLHFDRERLEQSPYHTLGEFLQSVPGLNIRDPNSGTSVQMTRSASLTSLTNRASAVGACHVGWFLDGHRVDLPGRTDPLTESFAGMTLDNIAGVEVFRGLSEMPAEYAAPDLRCGAISIWTRQ